MGGGALAAQQGFQPVGGFESFHAVIGGPVQLGEGVDGGFQTVQRVNYRTHVRMLTGSADKISRSVEPGPVAVGIEVGHLFHRLAGGRAVAPSGPAQRNYAYRSDRQRQSENFAG